MESPRARLIIISPHRDEIREEVGRAFVEWFEARTEVRLGAARTALAAMRQQQGSTEAVNQAIKNLMADWSPADLDPSDVPQRWHAWQTNPTPATAASLQAALETWQRGSARPRVEVIWQDIGGGTSQIARYVAARFQANPEGIGIDLVFGGGTDIYLRFANQGVLQPVDMSALLRDRIPKTLHGVPLYDNLGRWYGPIVSSFGILSNREVLRRLGQPEPQTWEDLASPGLRGWVGAGDPRLTGSVHMVYEIILQGKGWDEGLRTLLQLGANTQSFIRDSGTLTRTVITGETAAAGNIDVNALSAVGRNPEMMTFVLPSVTRQTRPDGQVVRSGGTIINADAIALLKGAPRPELGRAFIEFTLSDAGQRLFLLQPGVPGGPRKHPLCRLSVVEALYRQYPPAERSVGEANPFRQTDALAYKSDVGQKRWDALNDLIGAVIVDAHPELSAAWTALLASSLSAAEKQQLTEELFRPPCTEDELMAHARRIVAEGPHARVDQLNRWGEEARQRYRRVQAASERRQSR